MCFLDRMNEDTPGMHRLPKLMLSAASGLDDHSGILLPRGFHNDTICMVLHQLESLIHAYGHSRRDSSDSDEEVMKSF